MRILTGVVACLTVLFAMQCTFSEEIGTKPFLHPLFTDHMVLQRGMPIPVWGWTEPGKVVVVSLGGKFARAVAGPDGKWMVELPSFRAGGPYTLTVDGSQKRILSDVMIGDVWICSGQSNMAMGIKGVNNAEDEMAQADYPKIRFFKVANRIAPTPQETVTGAWDVCTPEGIRKANYSAVAYFFGRKLNRDLNVPIGLIQTAWGGTVAEAWTSAEALSTISDFRKPNPLSECDQGNNPNSLSVLYNGMVAPLINYGIKGAIWYQGESNVDRPMQYRTLLPTMINDWRSKFGVGEFPFLIVQLAGIMDPVEPSVASDWAEIREAQLLTATRVPKCGLAVAIDIGEWKNMHPKDKQDVGLRLALAAEGIAYKHKIEYSGPIYDKMNVEGKTIRLRFKHIGDGLTAKGDNNLRGFAIAGPDKKFVDADAKIDGKTVVLSAPGVENPTAARYDWANVPTGNLYNTADLPASPFRTDVD
jgi:sialate O-acetylesterase